MHFKKLSFALGLAGINPIRTILTWSVGIGATIIMVTLLCSCSKYDEGPGISFRSKEKRLLASWLITSHVASGGEVASFTIPESLEFKKAGEVKASFHNSARVWGWSWLGSKDAIRLSVTDDNGEDLEAIVYIDKLTYQASEFSFTIQNTFYELKLNRDEG